MPRNMSFSLTTEQFRTRSKTVTRRFGWHFLKPGDVVMGVEKAMGLKKGETVKRLGLIKILNVRQEFLYQITQDDVVREGFPEWTPKEFVQLLVDHHGCKPDSKINRIEFQYL